MTRQKTLQRLHALFCAAPVVALTEADRVVIFSDLHLGDGGTEDEFRRNAPLFTTVLREHYLACGFRLVLNGDIEELHKFSIERIYAQWAGVYALFDAFHAASRLHKLVGNHDLDLVRMNGEARPPRVAPALRLRLDDHDLFILHGHQALPLPNLLQPVGQLLVRHVASPLGIRNYSVAYDSDRKYRTEERIYEFARRHRVLAVIGHTHRPLFESLSRVDTLKQRIETLCRRYPAAGDQERMAIAAETRLARSDLEYTLAKDRNGGLRSSLYGANHVVPCVFNSGCAIGKRGVTAIEIAGGNIALVHWFDRARSERYFSANGYRPEQLGQTDFFRVALKEDSLRYIFARITLLA